MPDNRSGLVTVSVTGPDTELLRALTADLLEARLVACGNIIDGVRSLYRWAGEVCDDAEALVLLHTRADHVEAIIARVNQLHPYDTVQIVANPVQHADTAYSDWIMESTSLPAD